MARHHLIISGTGRNGTTFLVELFTMLGLPTGFSPTSMVVDKNANAGLEKFILDQDAPYIVKMPHLCDLLDGIAQRGDIVIDHAIVPMRDVFSAAESRRNVVGMADSTVPPSSVTGGLFGTNKPEEQEKVLTEKLYQLILAIATHDIPLTLLIYPRLKEDPAYLYRKLAFMLQGIDFNSFNRAYDAVYDPNAGHDFLARRRSP